MSSAYRRTVRGMRDLLPDEAEKLRFIEETAREMAKLYGYREVITPVVEHYELLAAKIGEETRKRMYVFEDLGGRRVALRPEFTASVARLVATKMVSVPKPLRLFSVGSLYRYDEPQFGRYREFWQANYELFGSSNPEADAEILILTDNLLRRIDLQSYHLKINHVGILRGILDEEGIVEEQQNNVMQLLDKKQWEEALRFVLEAGGSQRCLDSLKVLFGLRGKEPADVTQEIGEVVADYPRALEAVKNLSEVIGLAEESGAEVDFYVEAGFARGLEYYTGMIFEIFAPDMDIALGGGGRYDKLIELFGGGSVPAVGVAPGIDRMSLALDRQEPAARKSAEERVFVIPVGEDTVGEAFRVSSMLRKKGFRTELETMGRSVSRALSDADRRGITHAVIVGPREMKQGKVVLRDMKKRSQETVSLEELFERIRKTY
ncbi:MAG: histidine--tRNA ligase [Candidatus Bathyarchaeota archaeon]|nr:histidine--tRNA ligase [Candidatus Bathyarchaeota archaeon]